MASTIRCDIVSAEAEIFHGEATLVVATGELGELGIAPKHTPLITRLKPGKVVVTQPNGEVLDFAISGGILEVQPTLITLLADTAVRAKDLDEAKAIEAKSRAEEERQKKSSNVDFAAAEAMLAQSVAQIRQKKSRR